MGTRIAACDPRGLDAEAIRLIEAAEERGAPNANLCRVLGHRPEILKGFFHAWDAAFFGGTIDHRLKELVRVKVADVYGCGY